MTDDFELEELQPDFLFFVMLDGVQENDVFGPQSKRNWVMWKLSQIVIALEKEGAVTVERVINGERRICDDWRKLAH